jgi:hypothetical protein
LFVKHKAKKNRFDRKVFSYFGENADENLKKKVKKRGRKKVNKRRRYIGTMLETRNFIIYGAKALLKDRIVMMNLASSLKSSK